ncbi:hypothetical protein O6H91_15G043500 [Diphasiastrum complanatum]|uniref:Uncharacterized protein n=1 Tax=Diphasiastrum complanatum TaxID=34168 RepID=A0ACC2BIR4_DIPCM|nr:hypothetical protein O6H91_15G043500 [Diphasiastrum complanatum]
MGSEEGKGVWSELVFRKNDIASDSDSGSVSVCVQANEGGVKNQVLLVSSGSDSDTLSSSSKDAVDSPTATSIEPPLDSDAGIKPFEEVELSSSCNGDREASSETAAADENVGTAPEGSPKPVKSAWKKPVKLSTDPWEGTVMGDESWPSLEDSRSRKHSTSPRSAISLNSSDGNSEKEPASVTIPLGQQKVVSNNGPEILYMGHEKTDVSKHIRTEANNAPLLPAPVVPRTIVPNVMVQGPLHSTPLQESMAAPRAISPFPGNNVGRGRIPNQRGNGSFSENVWPPQRNRNGGFFGHGVIPHQQRSNNGNFLVHGGMHNQGVANGFYAGHVSTPRQRGRNGFSQNNFADRRVYRDQGRGNYWQSQQFFPNPPSHVQPFQQPFVDPRGVSWVNPTVYQPNAGFFNYPGFEGGHYPLMGTPGFPQDPVRYGHPRAIQVSPPIAPITHTEHLVAKQIEYYFSKDNLIKDIYLRSKMDAEGFVPASLIASFNKIRMLNADTRMILNALRASSIVEVQKLNFLTAVG